MRIRIVKDTKKYKKGQIVQVSSLIGYKLVKTGVGVMSKDMTEQEMHHG